MKNTGPEEVSGKTAMVTKMKGSIHFTLHLMGKERLLRSFIKEGLQKQQETFTFYSTSDHMRRALKLGEKNQR